MQSEKLYELSSQVKMEDCCDKSMFANPSIFVSL